MMRRKALEVAVVAGAGLAMAARFLLDGSPGTEAARVGFPLDDAWIHLVYARSLASGHGFEYNPGQAEAGFTSPLWVFALAPGFWLEDLAAVDIVAWSKGMGILASITAALLAGSLCRRLSGHRAAGYLASALVVLDPGLGFAQVSGMEVTLACAVYLGAIVSLEARRPLTAAGLLGLAALARPELALLTALFLPFVWWMLLEVGGRSTGKILGAGALAAGPFVAWMAYCQGVTGHPLPATFYAKHSPAAVWTSFADIWNTVASLAGDVPMFALGMGAVPWILGAVQIASRAGSGTDRAFRWATVLSGPVLLLGALWAHDIPQPLSFYWFRYLIPAFPAFAVVIAAGASLLARDAAPGESPAVRWSMRAAIAVTLLVTAALTAPGLQARASLYAWNCQNIDEVQVALGRWVASNVPPGEAIAVHDAGAIRFFGHRRTLDLLGLNAHRVLRGGMQAEIERIDPRYFVVFPGRVPFVADDPGLHVVHEAESANYTICRCDQARMVVVTSR